MGHVGIALLLLIAVLILGVRVPALLSRLLEWFSGLSEWFSGVPSLFSRVLATLGGRQRDVPLPPARRDLEGANEGGAADTEEPSTAGRSTGTPLAARPDARRRVHPVGIHAGQRQAAVPDRSAVSDWSSPPRQSRWSLDSITVTYVQAWVDASADPDRSRLVVRRITVQPEEMRRNVRLREAVEGVLRRPNRDGQPSPRAKEPSRREDDPPSVLLKAVSGAVATRLNESVSPMVWNVWVTPYQTDLGDAAERIGQISEGLHRVCSGRPAEVIGSQLGLTRIEDEVVGAVASALPLLGDRSFTKVKRGVQIAGIGFGAVTGIPLLLNACAEGLAHDLVSEQLAEGIQKMLTGTPPPVPKRTEPERMDEFGKRRGQRGGPHGERGGPHGERGGPHTGR
jgi:hypothetical protein